MKKKGKNFSGNNASGKRRAADSYETPYSITRQFLLAELECEGLLPGASLYDPAAGHGAITRVFDEMGFRGMGTDLISGTDFLTTPIASKYKKAAVVCNPPFSLAAEFLHHAIKNFDYTALLLPLSYIELA